MKGNGDDLEILKYITIEYNKIGQNLLSSIRCIAGSLKERKYINKHCCVSSKFGNMLRRCQDARPLGFPNLFWAVLSFRLWSIIKLGNAAQMSGQQSSGILNSLLHLCRWDSQVSLPPTLADLRLHSLTGKQALQRLVYKGAGGNGWVLKLAIVVWSFP